MTVEFKDSNVLLAGARSGRVILTDLRSQASVTRLQHNSAVTATRVIRDGNCIVVRGLQKVRVPHVRVTTYDNEPA